MALKFSIVTPTRNNLDKLKRCVGSVRGQTGVALEHIVQDACSDDGTPEWLAQQPDLRARSERDTGMYDAINRGWQRAHGDILSWLNSDEQYLPGALARVEREFARHPEIDLLYGNVLVVGNEGELVAARREIRLSRTYIANGFLNACSCATFFRRRLWDEGILALDDRFRYAADMDLMLRLLDAGKNVRQLHEYLSVFTIDGTNLSCHPQMLAETAAIQRKFGAIGFAPLRKAVMLGRYVERLLATR